MANCGFQSAAAFTTRSIQSRFNLLDPDKWDTNVGGVFQDTHKEGATAPCTVSPAVGWQGTLFEQVDLQNGNVIVNHLRIEYCWQTAPGGATPAFGEAFYQLDGTRMNDMSTNEGYLQVMEQPGPFTKIWFSKEADFGMLANIDCIDMEIFLLLGAIALALHA